MSNSISCNFLNLFWKGALKDLVNVPVYIVLDHTKGYNYNNYNCSLNFSFNFDFKVFISTFIIFYNKYIFTRSYFRINEKVISFYS